MKEEKLLGAIGKIDDDLIYNAVNDKKTKKPIYWLKWAAMAACLCLVIGLLGTLLPGNDSNVTAYAYGTEKMTAAGANMSTGSISDNGEITGHPLMFFLSGEDIDTVRFSCKNQKINFMDWTEKRDEFGQAQNFTVSYGENESEYYFLLIDWIPTETVRELKNNEDSTIATLPEELREDLIVMEITFANGETATKAIHISLKDDGTFFASFDDYKIKEEDSFVIRWDSKPIPREILYNETEFTVTFYDEEENEVLRDGAGWYHWEDIDHVVVSWTGAEPDTVQLYFTPKGTDMGEEEQLLMTKIPYLYGGNEVVFQVADLDKESIAYGNLEIELEIGSKRMSDWFNVIYDSPEIP